MSGDTGLSGVTTCSRSLCRRWGRRGFLRCYERPMNRWWSGGSSKRRGPPRDGWRLRQFGHRLIVGAVVAMLPPTASAQVGATCLRPLSGSNLVRAPTRQRDRVFGADWRRLRQLYPGKGDRAFIVVDIATQRLDLFLNGRFRCSWPVSTSRFGVGELRGSLRTPTGVFRVTGVVGKGAKPDAVLDSSGATGRFAVPTAAADDVAASNLILGRILKLEGLQPGWNEGGDVDTARRGIYIHGTANLGMLGEPASEGCVQMAPRAVIRLARLVPKGALVLITRGQGSLRKISGGPLDGRRSA